MSTFGGKLEEKELSFIGIDSFESPAEFYFYVVPFS